jgi:hypothetical protein
LAQERKNLQKVHQFRQLLIQITKNVEVCCTKYIKSIPNNQTTHTLLHFLHVRAQAAQQKQPQPAICSRRL